MCGWFQVLGAEKLALGKLFCCSIELSCRVAWLACNCARRFGATTGHTDGAPALAPWSASTFSATCFGVDRFIIYRT